MHPSFKSRALQLIGISILGAVSAQANQFNIGDTFTVAEASINPNEIINVTITSPSLNYSGGVYAGINQLLINGTQTVNGFCIDPFHYSSSSPLSFTVVNLANAPKGDPFSASGMGNAAALTIQELWGAHYSAGMSAADAATLQLAIWDVVGGSDFSSTSSLQGNATTPGTAEYWIAHAGSYAGVLPDLVGLTSTATDANGKPIGQDYVVQNVPDGAVTAALLGMTFLGLATVRKKLSTSIS